MTSSPSSNIFSSMFTSSNTSSPCFNRVAFSTTDYFELLANQVENDDAGNKFPASTSPQHIWNGVSALSTGGSFSRYRIPPTSFSAAAAALPSIVSSSSSTSPSSPTPPPFTPGVFNLGDNPQQSSAVIRPPHALTKMWSAPTGMDSIRRPKKGGGGARPLSTPSSLYNMMESRLSTFASPHPSTYSSLHIPASFPSSLPTSSPPSRHITPITSVPPCPSPIIISSASSSPSQTPLPAQSPPPSSSSSSFSYFSSFEHLPSVQSLTPRSDTSFLSNGSSLLSLEPSSSNSGLGAIGATASTPERGSGGGGGGGGGARRAAADDERRKAVDDAKEVEEEEVEADDVGECGLVLIEGFVDFGDGRGENIIIAADEQCGEVSESWVDKHWGKLQSLWINEKTAMARANGRATLGGGKEVEDEEGTTPREGGSSGRSRGSSNNSRRDGQSGKNLSGISTRGGGGGRIGKNGDAIFLRRELAIKQLTTFLRKVEEEAEVLPTTFSENWLTILNGSR